MERVVERGNVKAALKRVKQNKGSPGVDGMTVDELPKHLEENWETIRAQLLAGYGIINLYNILYGFRGETAEDYRAQAKVMRQIFHVQPPWSMSLARPDRGSPMFEQPGAHGITRLTPSRCYSFIYPKQFDLRKVSYFFEDERDEVPDHSAWDECLDAVAEWKDRWTRGPKPALTYVKGWNTLTIHDRRTARPRAHRFDDRTAELYELCADARRPEELLAKFEGDSAFLDGALEELTQQGLVLELDGKVLALALPDNPDH